MWKQSVWTSTICSHLATKHLREGGLLTLAGAKAALGPTAGMYACIYSLTLIYDISLHTYKCLSLSMIKSSCSQHKAN